MIRTLLAKDLRRARRNPLPWLIQLCIPILITAMIGSVFGPKSNPSGLGQIKMALVDEDDSPLTRFMRGALNQEEIAENLQAEVLTRDEAMRRITANKIAAVVAIPKGFTHDYLLGTAPVTLELIKNPANTIHPTVVEEGLDVLVTGLNAAARVFDGEFPELRKAFADDLEDGARLRASAKTMLAVADRFFPESEADFSRPIVWYKEAKVAGEAPAPTQARSGMFAYLLVGMITMFLLFIADNAARDFYRETTGRTLERIRTIRLNLMEFVSAKVLFSAVMVGISAVIMIVGGALLFGFSWSHGAELAVLVSAYSVFAAGFMAVIAGLAGTERRAGMFNNLLTTGLALGSGCLFPLEGQSMAFWREHVAVWFPTYWFANSARVLQFDFAQAGWVGSSVKLVLAGIVCIALAAALFRRRLEKGVRV